MHTIDSNATFALVLAIRNINAWKRMGEFRDMTSFIGFLYAANTNS